MVTTLVQSAWNKTGAVTEPPPAAGEAIRLLAALRDLAPELAARADEIEQGRRIPRDIADKLRHLGLFRTLVPRGYGGLELSVPELIPMLETLAAADGSVGWVAMNGLISQIFCSRLPLATYDRMYRGDPDVLVIGSGTPIGQAEPIDGGYRVSGRWPFASGCQNAQWLVGHCMVCKDGQPVMSDQGPMAQFIIAPAERWRIEETWDASGLTGSGSHHMVLDNVEVSADSAFDLFGGPSCVPGPLESSLAPLIPSLHGAVAVGMATGAVADLVSMADSGRRQLFAATDLRDSPVFQHELGRLDAELRAARALTWAQAEQHWRRAAEGTLDDRFDFAEALQGSAWIHAACINVVNGCYKLGGASSVLGTSPLQRRLRDIHAARQHILAHERYYVSAGKNALGFPAVHPISGQ